MFRRSSPQLRYEVEPYRPEPPRGLRLVAVLVNLLICPGVGHFVLGRFARGSFWIGLTLACALVVPLADPLIPLTLAGLLAPRVLSAVDALIVRFFASPSGNQLVLGILVSLAGVGLVLFVARTYYLEAFRIPSTGMSPTLAIGDHLYVNKLTYRLGDVKRGDVVVFLNPCLPDQTYIERVVALAGDKVEVRCDTLYVNGEAVPRRLVTEHARYWDRDEGRGWREQTEGHYVESLDGREYGIYQKPGATGEHDFPGPDLPDCSDYRDDDSEAGRDRGRIEGSTPGASACSPQRHYVVPDRHVFALGDNRDNSADSRTWGAVPVENIVGKAFAIWWSSGAPAEGIRWERIGVLE